MNIILGSLVNVYILIYLDDILIYLAMIEDYTKHVRVLFEQLAKLKSYLKHKKYALFLLQVEFLGHVVSERGVSVSSGKVFSI